MIKSGGTLCVTTFLCVIYGGVDKKEKKILSVVIYMVLAFLIVLADQFTKIWAIRALSDIRGIELLPFLSFNLRFNAGASFSFATGYTYVFTLLSFIVLLIIPVVAWKYSHPLLRTGLSIVFGGVIGNFIDRITRAPGFARGEVVDFITYGNTVTGNVADIAINIGVIVVAIYVLFIHQDSSDNVRVMSISSAETNEEDLRE
ncbi:MAG: signal peptidase II [Actinomycetaceae bacterium]|nr:signal peptidase II [Actinomycetaceae bacterium]